MLQDNGENDNECFGFRMMNSIESHRIIFIIVLLRSLASYWTWYVCYIIVYFLWNNNQKNSPTASWFIYYPQDGLRNKSAGNSIFLVFKVKLHKFVYPSSPTVEVHVIHPNCSQIPFLLHQSYVYILYELDVRILVYQYIRFVAKCSRVNSLLN